MTSQVRDGFPRRFVLAAVPVLLTLSGTVLAQSAPAGILAENLRDGGYVLVMRHTASPRTAPAKADANSDNKKLERQLDETGRATARAIGEAIKALRIPIGELLSSPTYRAMETVKLAALKGAKTVPQLGDGGQSMQASGGDAAAWLRTKVAERPRAGTNTLMITHMPNVVGAFGQSVSDIADGETLVFKPDGKGGSPMVARIKIEDWANFASP